MFSKKDIEFIGTFEPDSLPLGLKPFLVIYYPIRLHHKSYDLNL